MTKFYSCVKHLMLAGALFGVGSAYAGENVVADMSVVAEDQTRTVTGKVVDAAGQPVIGATILIKGTTSGAISNADGTFSINVAKGQTVEVSFIGYQTAEIVYDGQPSLDVQLMEDALAVEEVVVTALGINREAKSITYQVQEVSGDDILNSRDVNVTNSLTGKVAGLQVVRGGGATGSSKIILRGQTSLTGNNQPLIVVDGVPMDNFVGGGLDVWGNNDAYDMGNGLADLNAEDIESMSVLKGGAAAALYGSRAGNGVILITTKQGKANKGLGITVSAGVAVQDMLVQYDLQDQFSQGSYGLLNTLSRSSWGKEIDGSLYQNWNNQQEALQAYDNMNNFFRTGIVDTESVTFQQQINKTSVYSSITRMHEKSIVPGTSLDRVSITSRATTNLGKDDRWKLDVKGTYMNSKAQNRPLQGINQSNLFYTLANFPRSLDIRQFNPAVDASGDMIWWDKQDNSQDNPWWTAFYDLNNDARNRFMGFMSLSYQFTDWLSLEARGGIDYYSTRNYHKKHTGGASTPEGLYEEGMNDFMEQNYSYLLIARKDNLFGKFGGFITFGGNMMLQDKSSITASSGVLNIPNVFSLNNGVDKPTVSSTITKRRINSLYGSLQLNWDQAIFLDATLRNDWSSTMSKENRSYLYPSVGLSAVLSELINMPDWFSFAKVRGSYAEVGNDLAPYQLYTNYSVGKDYWGNPTINRGDILFDPDVRSELVRSWEAGVDLRFVRNRIKLDFTWYRTNATRQLIQIPMDASSGYKSRMINAGNIQNQGIELVIGANIFNTPKGFIWDASLNFSRNVNKILELADGISEYNLGTVEDIKVIAPVGGYYGELWGSTFKRVTEEDVKNGAPAEALGQMVVDGDGYPIKGDVECLGNQQPKFLIGFNNTFSYKNVTLDFLIDARIGGKMYSMTQKALFTNGNAAGTVVNGKRDNIVVDGWVVGDDGSYTKNTKDVKLQDYYSRLASGNTGITEAYTYDATSVRLRTLTLGYDFPQRLLQKTPIQRLKVSVTGNNLWLMYSDIPGLDPESVSGTGTNVQALELGVPPTTRSITFNVTIGF